MFTSGSYSQSFTTRDWAANPNGSRQGELFGTTKADGTFSSNESTTTTYTDGAATRIEYRSDGLQDGTDSAKFTLTD